MYIIVDKRSEQSKSDIMINESYVIHCQQNVTLQNCQINVSEQICNIQAEIHCRPCKLYIDIKDRYTGLRSENIYVVYTIVPCEDGDVRLVGRERAMEGRVEVCSNEMWGSVRYCGQKEKDANVICKQLGHSQFGIMHARLEYTTC